LADYQLFSITSDNEASVNFNTRTKEFEESGRVIGKPSFKLTNDEASLKIGKMVFQFKQNNSCYPLLQKIQFLLDMPVEGCPNTVFYYFRLYAKENGFGIPSDIPAAGNMEIDLINGIRFKDRPDLKLCFNFHKNLENSKETQLVYEKNSFIINFTANQEGRENTKYGLMLHYGTDYCKAKIENAIKHRVAAVCTRKIIPFITTDGMIYKAIEKIIYAEKLNI
jgi:hypothetical protein